MSQLHERSEARYNLGDGVDTLLALAAQPIDVRDRAVTALLHSAMTTSSA